MAAFVEEADEFAHVIRDAESEMVELLPPPDIADAHAEMFVSFAETSDRFEELASAAARTLRLWPDEE